MTEKRTGRGSDQFILRFPEGMRERIREAAESNRRSMNAEIIAVLEHAYPNPEIARLESEMTEEERLSVDADMMFDIIRQMDQLRDKLIHDHQIRLARQKRENTGKPD